MLSDINIPLTGNTATTDKIACLKCGHDALSTFPDGFSQQLGHFFHKDFTCFSYIKCRGDTCSCMWIHCFVCDKRFDKKQGYDRHCISAKHQKTMVAVITGLDLGHTKTRRGLGSKQMITTASTHAREKDMESPLQGISVASDLEGGIDCAMSVHGSSLIGSLSTKEKNRGVPLNTLHKLF
jgi:hypothetical protein